MYEELTDTEIIRLFHDPKTKEKAFNALLKKYQEKLYWHIRKMVIRHEDADDLLQETFIKVWNALDNFREESSLFTWLYRIATNEALTHLRQIKKRSLIPWASSEIILTNRLSEEFMPDADTLSINLQKAILSLPEKQRLVFNMKYYDDMKYEDMALILNTSVGALKASYHHAVKKIEKKISSN